MLRLRPWLEDGGVRAHADPPELAPVLGVVVHDQLGDRPRPEVGQASQPPADLRLLVDRPVDRLCLEHEADRDDVRIAVGVNRNRTAV